MDERLKLLSYSSLGLLHLCPRKFELYRKKSKGEAQDMDSSITFTYGHVIGEGIQLAFQGFTEDEIIWKLFLQWNVDLEARDIKRNKNFYLAVIAIQRFLSLRNNGFLDDYELVVYDGKPAVELGFRIIFPDGFIFRGSVDVVLRHKTTGEIVVLEVKTDSGTNINPAKYKNSAQAIGYSIVLDVIAPELSSYNVLYLVYKTKEMSYEQLKFPKSYLQRALWIQELMLDIETIKLYESAGVYPMRGESCLAFFKDCEYLQTCTLSTSLMTTPFNQEDFDKELEKEEEKFSISLQLSDLVNAQLAKVGG